MTEMLWMSVYWLTMALNVVAGLVALYFAGDFMLGLLLTNHEFSWTPLFYSWIPLGAMLVLSGIGFFAKSRAQSGRLSVPSPGSERATLSVSRDQTRALGASPSRTRTGIAPGPS